MSSEIFPIALALQSKPDSIVYCPERGLGTVQVKSVAPHVYAEQWNDPDTREIVPPVSVCIQAIHEAMLIGAKWAAVAVHRENYGSRPAVRLIEIPLHEKLWEKLTADTAKFWASIDADVEPAPDFKRDAEGIMRLYSDAEDRTVDLDGERAARIAAILDERAKLKEIEGQGNAAEKDRKVVDAEIIHALGNAEAGRLPDNRIIRAPTTRRSTIDAAVVRKEMGAEWAAARSKTSAYRTIRISGETA
jgi:predicted phage-related endonuclease